MCVSLPSDSFTLFYWSYGVLESLLALSQLTNPGIPAVGPPCCGSGAHKQLYVGA